MSSLILCHIFLIVVWLFISCKPIYNEPIKESAPIECKDTIDKPWDVCEDEGQKFACKKLCNHWVTMKRGRMVIR